MASLNPSNTLLFLSMLSFLCLTAHAADQVTPLFHVCANTTFSPSSNTIYQSNLNSLLSSLSSSNTEFYNATAGQNTTNPAYGLFLCKGDVTNQTCQDCVVAATKELAKTCSGEKQAVIWYDRCMVRYSNESFFSTVAVRPRFGLLNTGNITEQGRFSQLLNKTMEDLVAQASNIPIGAKKFKTKEVNFSAFQTVYNLVQCTPDLSGSDCNMCLRAALDRLSICCSGKQGARYLFPSCNVHYEVYPFYTIAPAPVLPTPPPKGKSKISTVTIIAIVVPIAASVVLIILGYCFLSRRTTKKSIAVKGESLKKSDHILIYLDGKTAANEITGLASLQFDFGTIEASTNRFSDDNKLGEGGFGEVYKGKLPNGQEVAVKRLSKSSGQDAEQFKNEVVLVAKLQHRNLARLLGFCLEGEEKILIYEFVPNKSLDYYLYDPKKKGQLNWSRRYNIIGGIARGIQYLHKDCQLSVIHRDLKASSILLDGDMNPKISDFGMARILGADQTQGNASRIVGTYGYMAPEYAMHGEFSVKTDVYSFGVLVLEIINGKKNSNFQESEDAEDLLSYAWIRWREGRPLELLDPTLEDSSSREEVMRCIHIGLLCVQKDPADRPTIASIVVMLNSNSVTLPSPQQPAFFVRSKPDPNMPREDLEFDQYN